MILDTFYQKVPYFNSRECTVYVTARTAFRSAGARYYWYFNAQFLFTYKYSLPYHHFISSAFYLFIQIGGFFSERSDNHKLELTDSSLGAVLRLEARALHKSITDKERISWLVVKLVILTN